MTKPGRNLRLLTIIAALSAGACKTVGGAGAPGGGYVPEVPAVLASADDIPALREALARAVGRARAELGGGDPTRDSTVAVLPPPLGPHEDRSTAMPALFDLVLRGGDCYAVSRETGEATALKGVECRPLE